MGKKKPIPKKEDKFILKAGEKSIVIIAPKNMFNVVIKHDIKDEHHLWVEFKMKGDKTRKYFCALNCWATEDSVISFKLENRCSYDINIEYYFS